MTKKEIIQNLSKEECLNLINQYFSIKDILKKILNVNRPNHEYFIIFKSVLQQHDIISDKLSRARFTSPISRISSEDFKRIFYSSTSVKECLSYFGLNIKGGSSKTLKNRCKLEGLDYNYLVNHPNKVYHTSKKYETKDMFFENSEISHNAIKKRILEEKLLPYFCQVCEREPLIIHGNLEVLVLDHINGINNDHRLENLRFVCGTCNLHLSTTGSRNRKNKSNIPSSEKIKEIFIQQEKNRSLKISSKKTKIPHIRAEKNFCSQCEKNILNYNNKSGICLSCIKKTKYTQYDIDEVFNMVVAIGYVQTGKAYGVSDNAVKKWLKKEGLNPLEKKSTENFLKMAFELQKFFSTEQNILPSSDKNKELFLFMNVVRDKYKRKVLKREEQEILDSISLRILHPLNKSKDLEENILELESFIKEHKRIPKRTNKNKIEYDLAEWIKTSYRYNNKSRISAIEALFEKYNLN